MPVSTTPSPFPHKRRGNDLGWALEPGDVDDLGELGVDGIGGEETLGTADGGGERDGGVDVKHSVRSAGRPDDGLGVGGIVVEVVAGEGSLPCGAGAGLSSLSGEVVDGLLGAGDALIESGVSTVVGGEDGVLEAAGVLEVQVKLAILAALGDGDTGTDGGDVLVEDEGHDGAVLGDGRSNGEVGAASSSVGDTDDLD